MDPNSAYGMRFGGSGWLRSVSDRDRPVRRNSRAPRSGFVSGRCLGTKDGDRAPRLAAARFLAEPSLAEARYSSDVSTRLTPKLLRSLPPSFDDFFLAHARRDWL